MTFPLVGTRSEEGLRIQKAFGTMTEIKTNLALHMNALVWYINRRRFECRVYQVNIAEKIFCCSVIF